MQLVEARAARRFTAQEYEQIIAAGVLREGERVELLEGEIITMAAMGLPQIAASGCNFQYYLMMRVSPNLIWSCTVAGSARPTQRRMIFSW